MEEQFKEHLSESVNPEDPVPEIFALDSSLNRFYKMTVNPQKDTVYAACGLSPMEASALVVLHDIQPVTMSKLAHYCGFSPSKTTRAVNVLVKKGLARREVPEENRRQVYASVTDRGYELVEENNRRVFERFASLLSDFSPAEKQKMLACYSYILEMYGRHCGHPLTPTEARHE